MGFRPSQFAERGCGSRRGLASGKKGCNVWMESGERVKQITSNVDDYATHGADQLSNSTMD